MDEATRFPLAWPIGRKRTKYPEQSRFGSHSLASTCKDCIDEIERLGGSYAVISTNIALRQDGLPYSNQRAPGDPGVAVYFRLPIGGKSRPYCLSCDRWNRVECNLWAVVKHIEAMRGQERWGVGSVEEQFKGYEALPDRSRDPQWWVFTLELKLPATLEAAEAAYRSLAKSAHPDLPGGCTDRMSELNAAIAAARKELAT